MWSHIKQIASKATWNTNLISNEMTNFECFNRHDISEVCKQFTNAYANKLDNITTVFWKILEFQIFCFGLETCLDLEKCLKMILNISTGTIFRTFANSSPTLNVYLFIFWQIWTVKPLYKLLKANVFFKCFNRHDISDVCKQFTNIKCFYENNIKYININKYLHDIKISSNNK